MFDAGTLRGVVIVAGHYGVGKTNLALNLCLDAAHAGAKVTCVDLDIVNPYFRSSDYSPLLADAGVDLIAPLFAGTSLDSPGLSGRIIAALEETRADENRLLVIDAGGDDAGVTALGRFARFVQNGPYAFFYVVNANRNLTQTPEEAASLLAEIEAASHLKATAVINNSHLKAETTAQIITDSSAFGIEVARLLDLPLLAQTAPNTLDLPTRAEYAAETAPVDRYPVKVYVTAPWER